MTNTLTHVEVTRLPELKPEVRILQLSIEYWQKMHAEARAQREEAWKLYTASIDNGEPRAMIENCFVMAEMLEDICKEAWREHEQAKRNLLDFWN